MPVGQKHRTLVVGQHHEFLQQRRREQGAEAFREIFRRRNAIEGSLSELVRARGLRRSRYRDFAKVELQNLLIGTACNVKRWVRVISSAKDVQTKASALVRGFQSLPERVDCVLPFLFGLTFGNSYTAFCLRNR